MVTELRAVFFQNFHDAYPGHLVEILGARRIKLVVCRVFAGERLDITDFHMAFFGGAPLDPNDQDEATLWQISQIRIGLQQRIPMFGICRGLQLLVLAAGGAVVPSSVEELGMYTTAGTPFEVHLTSQGKQDILLRGFEAARFRVFQMHKLMCDLRNIPDAVLLGWADGCYVQMVRIGTMYGMQSHIEFSLAMMEYFAAKAPDFQKLGSNLLEEFRQFYDEYLAFTTLIINNFVDFVMTAWRLRAA